eukprot:m.264756 g.264756  ORF g.264756 m.264756 type:complete len:488 (-) comp28544_c0_seq1:83-1546(-)
MEHSSQSIAADAAGSAYPGADGLRGVGGVHYDPELVANMERAGAGVMPGDLHSLSVTSLEILRRVGLRPGMASEHADTLPQKEQAELLEAKQRLHAHPLLLTLRQAIATEIQAELANTEPIVEPAQTTVDADLRSEGIIGPRRASVVVGPQLPKSEDGEEPPPAAAVTPASGLAGIGPDGQEVIDTLRARNEREEADLNQPLQEQKEFIIALLNEQQQYRVVLDRERALCFAFVDACFTRLRGTLKTALYDALDAARNHFSDKSSGDRAHNGRRERRNFSKQAREILSEYFYSHLDNPYPSEAQKAELATRCGITVSQVTNWFGNKRIRYKKNIGRPAKEMRRTFYHQKALLFEMQMNQQARPAPPMPKAPMPAPAYPIYPQTAGMSMVAPGMIPPAPAAHVSDSQDYRQLYPSINMNMGYYPNTAQLPLLQRPPSNPTYFGPSLQLYQTAYNPTLQSSMHNLGRADFLQMQGPGLPGPHGHDGNPQ